MEENKVLSEVDEAIADVDGMNNDELKSAINDTLSRIRTQSMIVGYRTACMTIMQMISGWHQPNCSYREYQRIFKKVEEFCSKALKQEETKAEESAENQGDN